MTGGGFGEFNIFFLEFFFKFQNFNDLLIFFRIGGCTVSLVLASEIDNVIRQIDSEYHGATFYVSKASNGAREIDLGNLN